MGDRVVVCHGGQGSSWTGRSTTAACGRVQRERLRVRLRPIPGVCVGALGAAIGGLRWRALSPARLLLRACRVLGWHQPFLARRVAIARLQNVVGPVGVECYRITTWSLAEALGRWGSHQPGARSCWVA